MTWRRLFVPCGILVLSTAACVKPAQESPSSSGAGGVDHALVFVQATLQPAVNRLVIERGVWPVVRCLTASDDGLHFELAALYDRTSAGTILMQGDVPPGLNGRREANRLRERFIEQGRTLLDRLYAENAPEFVDVLGSVFVIDRYVARTGVVPHVIYVSEMVQRTGIDGYDFSGNGDVGSLARAAHNLERDYGTKLRQRPRLAGMRVDAIQLDLTLLARAAGPEVPSVAQVITPVDELEAFWRDKFFAGLLRARMTLHQPGATCKTLGLD